MLFEWLRHPFMFDKDDGAGGGGNADPPDDTSPADDHAEDSGSEESQPIDISDFARAGEHAFDGLAGEVRKFFTAPQPDSGPPSPSQYQPPQPPPGPFAEIDDPGPPDANAFDDDPAKALDQAMRHARAQAIREIAPHLQRTEQTIAASSRAEVERHQTAIVHAVMKAKQNWKDNLQSFINEYPELASDAEVMNNFKQILPHLMKERLGYAARFGRDDPRLIDSVAQTFSKDDMFDALSHAAIATRRYVPGKMPVARQRGPNLVHKSRAKTDVFGELSEEESDAWKGAKDNFGLTDADLAAYTRERS